MTWPYRGIIILLLVLLSQTDYLQACDEDCKDDLMQRFEILLDSKMDSKMDLIKKELENNVAELKTLHSFIKSQLTDNLAQDRATQNPASSLTINDLNDPIDNLKTLTRESNIIIKEIREYVEDCKGTSNTTTQQLNDILENMEEINQNRMEADNGTMSNEVERCPRGFFNVSSQCFKMFRDRTRNWSAAKTKCGEDGHILAQPDEAIVVPLRSHLYEAYGDDSFAWLGAQGDGSKFVYVHGGLALDNDSPLWAPDHPGSYGVDAESCLMLLVGGNGIRNYPASPYWSDPCHKTNYALCEAK
ncbi:unnamed protein product [Meganyctiphanes norvegica]|uniref:C-type lectin domain-containing protein n=1 Tax=Meganyctiphanes norvegica TaxID=48144 RepID=A0AAV2R3S3_MEGNR